MDVLYFNLWIQQFFSQGFDLIMNFFRDVTSSNSKFSFYLLLILFNMMSEIIL